MKKMMSMWLTVLLVFTSIPVTFAASDDPCAGTDFTCDSMEGQITIKGYTGSAKEVSIPEKIGDQPVTGIGYLAFSFKGLTSVELPDSVTTIGFKAFEGNSLTSIKIPNGVTVVESSAFQNNSLTSVELPTNLKTIGYGAFKNNSLTSVEIPETVTSIITEAFQNNRLTSVTIPNDMELYGNAFKDNPLELITFEGSPTFNGSGSAFSLYQGFEGWYTDKELSNKITWDGNNVPTGKVLYGKRTPNPPTGVSAVAGDNQATISFTGPIHAEHNMPTGYTVHAYVNGEKQQESTTGTESPIKVTGLTNYTEYTFKVIATNKAGNSAESTASQAVTPSLYEFGENGDGVTITKYLGTATEIEIPNTLDGKAVTAIGQDAFKNKGLTRVTIPASVTEIGYGAFENNQLEHITFEGSPTMNGSAFSTTETIFPEFVGWYTDESLELELEWDGTSVPTGGILYAMRKPNPPTNVSPQVGDGEVSVSFTSPEHIGGNAVTEYTVKVYKDGIEQPNLKTTGNASPIMVKGLTNETNYTFKVTAKNKAGESKESNASEAVEAVVIYETTVNVDGTVTITKYNGTATEVEIPSTIDGKKVTAIGTEAFYNKGLTSVVIPDGVITIGNKAFQNNELTSVEIPDGVTTIGKEAFYSNQLASVAIAGTVTTIGDTAFANNKLKSVVIPASVETIGSFAFYENRIEHVTFNSTPEIGQLAFGEQGFPLYTDESLQTIWNGTSVPEGGQVYAKRIPDAPTDVTVIAGVEEAIVSFTGPTHLGGNVVTGYTVKVYVNGTEQTDLEKTGDSSPITVTGLTNGTAYTFKVVAMNAAGVGPESETTIGVTPKDVYEYFIDMMDGTVTITGYNGTEKEVEIPSHINGKVVTGIGDNVFKDKGLTSVDLPNTITSFGEHAFSGNQLTKVEIKKAGDGKYIKIGANAFSDNKITEVTLPVGLGELGDNAFFRNELRSLEFPGSLRTIGDNAFSHNKLTNLTITNRLDGMGKGAFSYNELESVTFERGVGRIADSAFSHNKLTSVTLPASVSTIGNNAFASNRLECVTFNSTPTIGTDAFKQNDETVFPEFIGWYTDEELQDEWDGTSAPGGQELFAKRTPSTPTEVNVAAGDAEVTISFTGLEHTGGNAVTEYAVKVYVDGIEQTDLLTTGKTSPITVKGLSNGTSYTFTVIATNAAGTSVETAQTKAVKPVKPGGGGNGGGGTPGPGTDGGSAGQPGSSTDGGSPSKPTSEQITVPGSVSQDTFVSETLITRNKDTNGILRDEAIFTDEQAKEAVQNTNSSLKETVRMVITDTKDEVSEVHVKVAKEAVEKLAHAGVNFEVYTHNVLIQVPQGSLDGFDKELYFRVTPIKEAEKKKEVETRARAEEAVKQMSNGMTITLLGRPMTIETNMQSRPVTLTLPLHDMELPTESAERDLFVADLVIFIEHSDGSKELVKPKLEKLENGEYGLQFGVDKFSTFTILKTEGFQDSSHEGYIKGFGDGTFKPNQSITRAHMAVMLARILGYTGSNEIGDAPFKDIKKNHINAGEIAYVKEKGIMNGYENGDFGASNTITRAEMATIVANYKQLEIVKNVPLTFPDTKGNWAQWIIEANKKARIINGREDGTFGPNDSLTRAQAVVMINRMFDRGPLYGVTTPSFSDVPTTHWAFTEVEEAAQNHFFKPRPNGEDIIK